MDDDNPETNTALERTDRSCQDKPSVLGNVGREGLREERSIVPNKGEGEEGDPPVAE